MYKSRDHKNQPTVISKSRQKTKNSAEIVIYGTEYVVKKCFIKTPIYSFYFGENRATREPVSMTLYAQHFKTDQIASKLLINTIETIIPFQHPAIAKIIGHNITDGFEYPVVATEYLENGTLGQNFNQINPKFDNTVKYMTAIGIASALDYIYKQNPNFNFINININPDNIYYDYDFEPHLLNFFTLSYQPLAPKGAYRAPENKGPETTIEMCVFSFSMILYELMTNVHPFASATTYKEAHDLILRGERPHFHDKVPFKDLIMRGWDEDPKKRPLPAEIVYLLKNVDEYSGLDIVIARINKYIDKLDKAFMPNINISTATHFKTGSVHVTDNPPNITEHKARLLSDFIVMPNNFHFDSSKDGDDFIGHGSFADVFRASDSSHNGMTVAYKQYTIKTTNKITQVSLLREFEILVRLEHPSIVSIFGHYLFSQGRCIPSPILILEYLENGSLHDVLHNIDNHQQFDSTARMKALFGIASALSYIHSRKPIIIHRDLKPDNVMLDSNYEIRMCDFNMAKIVEKFSLGASRPFGTPLYRAPEISDASDQYTPSVDVFSFGMIAFYLITGSRPFKGFSNAETVEKIKRGERPQIDSVPFLKNLITRTWNQNPDLRPTAEDLTSCLRNAMEHDMIPDTNYESYLEYVRRIDKISLLSEPIEQTDYQLSTKIIKKSKYKIRAEIAKTDSNKVLVAVKKTCPSIVYACKELLSNDPSNIRSQHGLLRELEVYSIADHPAIPALHGCDLFSSSEDSNPSMLIDYIDGGDLLSIQKNEGWNNTTRMICLIGIASVLSHLHSLHISHNDLTPSDILFDSCIEPHVIDYNNSTIINSNESSISPKLNHCRYKSPELLKKESINDRSDIFSFGLIAYVIIKGSIPFSDLSDKQIIEKYTSTKQDLSLFSTLGIPLNLSELLESCLKIDPYLRPTASELFNKFSDSQYFLSDVNQQMIEIYLKKLIPSNNPNKLHHSPTPPLYNKPTQNPSPRTNKRPIFNPEQVEQVKESAKFPHPPSGNRSSKIPAPRPFSQPTPHILMSRLQQKPPALPLPSSANRTLGTKTVLPPLNAP